MLNETTIPLSNKISRLTDEVRKDIHKICKLDKPIKDMTWEEKMTKLPSDAWMIEQMMFQIEQYVRRQSGLIKWKPPAIRGD
tara:strand:- start:3126 stop:3371 length:246 start_codon:yes stop_codon:yes gene_type:complete